MSKKSISVWMYLCRAPRYFKTKFRSESLIPSLVCKVWKVLVNFGTSWPLSCRKCGPSHVLVLIVANRVILFLYRIHKKIPSGIDPIYSRLLYGTLLPVSFPQMFDMGESLKECEGDLFLVGKNMNKQYNLLADLTIYLGHLHLFDLQIWEYQN
jgi:hypothetical protein